MSIVSAPPDAPLVSAESVSIVRLHGEACWTCGAVAGLETTGQVSTVAEGGIRVWPIVACPGCRGVAQ